MDLVATKVVVLILLGLIKLVSGLIPLILDKVLQVKKVRLRLFLVLYICSATAFASPVRPFRHAL